MSKHSNIQHVSMFLIADHPVLQKAVLTRETKPRRLDARTCAAIYLQAKDIWPEMSDYEKEFANAVLSFVNHHEKINSTRSI